MILLKTCFTLMYPYLRCYEYNRNIFKKYKYSYQQTIVEIEVKVKIKRKIN